MLTFYVSNNQFGKKRVSCIHKNSNKEQNVRKRDSIIKTAFLHINLKLNATAWKILSTESKDSFLFPVFLAVLSYQLDNPFLIFMV